MKENDFVLNIKNAFKNELPGSEIFVFETTESTNTLAKSYTKDLTGNAFFISEMQTGGRGQKGHSFSSEKGGLYLSFLSFPKIPSKDAVKLTLFSAVCLCETIAEFTNVTPKIKWINDVFIGNKKLAGILTEGEFSPDGKNFRYAVVGIGVNLNKTKFPKELQNIATDLESESGVAVDVASFAVSLAKKLVRFESCSPDEYMKKYKELSFIIGERVRIKTSESEYFAKAMRINDDGSLDVVLEDGKIQNLCSAEVSICAIQNDSTY